MNTAEIVMSAVAIFLIVSVIVVSVRNVIKGIKLAKETFKKENGQND